MPLSLASTRFGTLEIDDASVIEFPQGLIGLGGRRFALVARHPDSPFAWLQSLDDPALALPVTRPGEFFPDYEVVLSDDDADRIGISDPADAELWVTVKAAPELEEFHANLRAPLVLAGGRGWQVLNEAEEAPLRAPLFAG
jgi:flagellar assembly factor FliW